MAFCDLCGTTLHDWEEEREVSGAQVCDACMHDGLALLKMVISNALEEGAEQTLKELEQIDTSGAERTEQREDRETAPEEGDAESAEEEREPEDAETEDVADADAMGLLDEELSDNELAQRIAEKVEQKLEEDEE